MTTFLAVECSICKCENIMVCMVKKHNHHFILTEMKYLLVFWNNIQNITNKYSYTCVVVYVSIKYRFSCSLYYHRTLNSFNVYSCLIFCFQLLSPGCSPGKDLFLWANYPSPPSCSRYYLSLFGSVQLGQQCTITSEKW